MGVTAYNRAPVTLTLRDFYVRDPKVQDSGHPGALKYVIPPGRNKYLSRSTFTSKAIEESDPQQILVKIGEETRLVLHHEDLHKKGNVYFQMENDGALTYRFVINFRAYNRTKEPITLKDFCVWDQTINSYGESECVIPAGGNKSLCSSTFPCKLIGEKKRKPIHVKIGEECLELHHEDLGNKKEIIFETRNEGVLTLTKLTHRFPERGETTADRIRALFACSGAGPSLGLTMAKSIGC